MMSSVWSSISPSLTRIPPHTSATAAPAEMPRTVAAPDRPSAASTFIVVRNSVRARTARSSPRRPACPNAFNVASPCTLSRKSAPRSPYALRRAWFRLRFSFWITAGRNSVTSAKTRNTSPMRMSSTDMNTKISTGATAATMNCGRYWPKKTSRLSTPSTSDVRMSPVRLRSKWPGPSSNECWYRRLRSSILVRVAVRYPTASRTYWNRPRSNINTPTRTSGPVTAEKSSPWKRRAMTTPVSASRAMPMDMAISPTPAARKIAVRRPLVIPHSLRLKYTLSPSERPAHRPSRQSTGPPRP